MCPFGFKELGLLICSFVIADDVVVVVVVVEHALALIVVTIMCVLVYVTAV